MKSPKYVQAWVDRRDDRAYYYLRRRGFPRVRLPGLPWSPSFMAEYEKAMAGPRTAIGAGRIKPGSVAAVVAEYFELQAFFGSKSAGTQRTCRHELCNGTTRSKGSPRSTPYGDSCVTSMSPSRTRPAISKMSCSGG